MESAEILFAVVFMAFVVLVLLAMSKSGLDLATNAVQSIVDFLGSVLPVTD